MLHPDFERELATERAERMRAEVERDRLEALLARAACPEGGAARGGGVARGVAFVRALFGAHPAG